MGGGGLEVLAEVEREEGADGSYAELRGGSAEEVEGATATHDVDAHGLSLGGRVCFSIVLPSFLCLFLFLSLSFPR